MKDSTSVSPPGNSFPSSDTRISFNLIPAFTAGASTPAVLVTVKPALYIGVFNPVVMAMELLRRKVNNTFARTPAEITKARCKGGRF